LSVRWGAFSTFPDGKPKFADAWLMSPSNVVSSFPSKPHQYCRLCDSYFEGGAQEHVSDHVASLVDWRKLQAKKSMAVPAPPDFPRNHASRNGRDTGKEAERDAQVEFADSPASCPHPLSEKDRRKAHSPAARKRRKQTFKTKTEARRAEAWKLYARGLVPKAIAEQLGISDRTLRRYLAENGALTSGDQLRRLM
jgi:hypothetical protein